MKTKDKKKNAFVVYVRVYPIFYIYSFFTKRSFITLFLPRNYLKPFVSLQYPFWGLKRCFTK